MGRETTDRVHLGLNPEVLAVDTDAVLAVHQPAAEGAVGLEADDQHVAAAPSEVLLQVMDDAPAGAHATAGDDDGAAVQPVDGLGLLDGPGQAQVREPGHLVQPAAKLGGLGVVELGIVPVDAVASMAMGLSRKICQRPSPHSS